MNFEILGIVFIGTSYAPILFAEPPGRYDVAAHQT